MLTKAMDAVKFKPGEQIINQGDKGDKFYVIGAGTCDISVKGKGSVMTASRGVAFGELALMFNQPRAATVTAEGDVVAWQASRRWSRPHPHPHPRPRPHPCPHPHPHPHPHSHSHPLTRARTGECAACLLAWQVDAITFKSILMTNWKPPEFQKSKKSEALLTKVLGENLLFKEIPLLDRQVTLALTPILAPAPAPISPAFSPRSNPKPLALNPYPLLALTRC